MIKNYLTVAFRYLIRNKGFAFLNIFGLSIALACVVFISLYVNYELSFDRFHKNHKDIYRISVDAEMGERDEEIAITPAPMAETLENEVDGVKRAGRMAKFGSWLVSANGKSFNEDHFLFADSSIFDIFSFEIIEGKIDNPLSRPYTVVLSQSTAKKYFHDESPIGKRLVVENDTNLYEVVAVVEDLPPNSHFHFDLLGSLNSIYYSTLNLWVSHSYYTYVLKKPGHPEELLYREVNDLVEKYVIPQIEEITGIAGEEFVTGKNNYEFILTPLNSIHLFSEFSGELEPNSSFLYVFIFASVGLLIILIACINYVNISTAATATRLKESGIRKVLGSSRKAIMGRFYFESLIGTLVALLLALVLVELYLPDFNYLAGLELDISMLFQDSILIFLAVIIIIVTILTGTYPAMYFSRKKPVSILKGKNIRDNKGKIFRNVLVGFQMMASVAILTATFGVHRQLTFVDEMELGFDKKNLLIVNRSDAIDEQIQDFKNELKLHPGIHSVSNSTSIPGREMSSNSFITEHSGNRKSYIFNQVWVSPDFGNTYNLELIEGRFISTDPSDSLAIVINEKGVEMLGFSDPVGKTLILPSVSENVDKHYKIVGVIKDIYYQSLYNEISPMVFTPMPNHWEGYISVYLDRENMRETLKYIYNTWNKYTSKYPFSYFFLEDDLVKLYKSEYSTRKLLNIFSLIASLIAVIGLIGLISFTTNRRTKEIGVRKTFGASIHQIVFLLFRQVIPILFIGVFLAWPVAYLLLNYWMKNFSYAVSNNPGIFVLASFAMLGLSFIVMSFIIYQGARRNPVYALRYE